VALLAISIDNTVAFKAFCALFALLVALSTVVAARRASDTLIKLSLPLKKYPFSQTSHTKALSHFTQLPMHFAHSLFKFRKYPESQDVHVLTDEHETHGSWHEMQEFKLAEIEKFYTHFSHAVGFEHLRQLLKQAEHAFWLR
jgi:hypothetical protein